jgi:hypothetical protein
MHAIIPLTVLPFQVAFWKFDDHGAVLNYDAWIPNLNDWIEASLGISISNPQVEMQTIQQLCAVTQQRCTGSNTQWISIEECVSTLSQKPYGNYDEAWGDNIVCRTIHLVLTQVRPQVSSLLHQARVSWPKADTKLFSNRSIAPMLDPQEAANVWTLHIHSNTSTIRPFTMIHSVRRSHAIDYAVGSTTPLPEILCCIHSPSQGPKIQHIVP